MTTPPRAFRVQLRRLADQAEIDTVEACPIAHFDAAEFDAHHGGILPRHGFHVRAVEGIGLPVLHLPGVPVGKVVLVAVQDLSASFTLWLSFAWSFCAGVSTGLGPPQETAARAASMIGKYFIIDRVSR